MLRGDVGGFDIGSKFSWNVIGAFSFDLAVRHGILWSGVVGYGARAWTTRRALARANTNTTCCSMGRSWGSRPGSDVHAICATLRLHDLTCLLCMRMAVKEPRYTIDCAAPLLLKPIVPMRSDKRAEAPGFQTQPTPSARPSPLRRWHKVVNKTQAAQRRD